MIKAIITNDEKFEYLIEELEAILKEGRFIVQFELMKIKWLVGKSIEETFSGLKRKDIYGLKIDEEISQRLRTRKIPVSRRDIRYCRQFFQKYPLKDWELVEANLSKNTSWTKEKLSLRGINPEECQHNFEELNYWSCKGCGKKLFSLPEVDNSVK